MLLDEAPSTLIHECIGNFNIAPDRAVLTRIGGSLSELSSHRDSQNANAEIDLKRSTRNLHSLQQKQNIILSAHDPVKHAESIAKYDDERFRLAKEANTLESEGSRLEGEIGGLRKQLESTDKNGEGAWVGRENELGDVLRLKLYRSLGVDASADGSGRVTKALVRNSQNSDVAVVQIDTKSSNAEHVDRIWDAI
ncbi:MAG: hypothetical protein Q9162_002532 [Coniocarpon cinnabarinum]